MRKFYNFDLKTSSEQFFSIRERQKKIKLVEMRKQSASLDLSVFSAQYNIGGISVHAYHIFF
jgi:hypothetical protein